MHQVQYPLQLLLFNASGAIPATALVIRIVGSLELCLCQPGPSLALQPRLQWLRTMQAGTHKPELAHHLL